jgi:hypothetical protein
MGGGGGGGGAFFYHLEALLAYLVELLVDAVEADLHGARHRLGLAPRVISDGHFAVQLNHFIPAFLSYPVAFFTP